MATITPITSLPAASSVASTDLAVVVQGTTTRKATAAQLVSGGLAGSLSIGNIQATSSLFTPVTFVGNGLSANMIANFSAARQSNSTPAVAEQVTITSNYGSANAGLQFTVAHSASVIATINSGNIYGMNPIVQGYAGVGGYQVTGVEANLNQLGADAHFVDAATAAYGFTATSAGTAHSTAGYRAYGLAAPAGMYYGFAASGNIVQSAFYDNSSTAASSLNGPNGAMLGSATKTRQSLLHSYISGGNTMAILGRYENDNAGTGTGAIGFSVTYSGSETRSAKGGIGITRAYANGGGPVTIFNRRTNDTSDFTASDAQTSFGVTANFSGQSVIFNQYQETAAGSGSSAETVAHFGITSSVGGATPSIAYKAALTGDATASNGSGYIWGENFVVNLDATLANTTTGASGTGATATITFSGGRTIPVGQSIKVYGVTPTGYNAIATVTASSAGSVSYANATTGVQTVAGTVAEYVQAIGSEINVNISNAAYTGNGGPYVAGYFVTGTVANTSVYGTGAFVASYGAATGTLFNYGALFSETSTGKLAKTATISDQTTSPIVLHSNTAHTNGIDFSGASFSGGSALISANNTNVSFLDSGATPRVAIALDASNILQIGAAAINSISSNAPLKFPSYTTAQKNALTASAGWMLFDTTLGKMCIYTGASWQTITSV